MRKNTITTVMALFAIVAALGLVGVVGVTMLTIQEAEAVGCERGKGGKIAYLNSEGRCGDIPNGPKPPV